jgi:hypothetical protein
MILSVTCLASLTWVGFGVAAPPLPLRLSPNHLAVLKSPKIQTARRLIYHNLEERSDLILAFARVLYVNGQSTDQTLAAAAQLGDALGLRARILPRWGEPQLQANDRDARLVSTVAADPTGVHMDRVASTMQAINDLDIRQFSHGLHGSRSPRGSQGKPP